MRTRDPRKEQAIRRKALELIVRSGLDGFSMQNLARAARVSPATLYIYFQDRDDLLFQVYRTAATTMTEEVLRGFDPDGGFADGLRLQWRNRARYALAHPREARFLEQVRHSPYFSPFQARLPQEFREMMRRFAQNAISRREMRPMPPEIFWALVYSPLYQLIRFAQEEGGFFSAAHGRPKFELTDEVLEAALQGVLRAVRP